MKESSTLWVVIAAVFFIAWLVERKKKAEAASTGVRVETPPIDFDVAATPESGGRFPTVPYSPALGKEALPSGAREWVGLPTVIDKGEIVGFEPWLMGPATSEPSSTRGYARL